MISDPIRDPIFDPIRDGIRDPFRDPIRDPIRSDPVRSRFCRSRKLKVILGHQVVLGHSLC